MQETAKYIMAGGAIVIVIGLIVYFFHDSFRWLGNLPGDIRIKSENLRLYFPIVTMIIISLVITIIVNIFRRLF